MNQNNEIKKVYCDLCGSKIYLSDFPRDWDALDTDRQAEYMNNQIRSQEGGDSLAAWTDTGGPVEEWTLVCKRCEPDTGAKVTVGLSMPLEDWEATIQELDKGDTANMNIESDAETAALEFDFTLPKSQVRRLYLLLKISAGLDMPLGAPDMAVFVDNERYEP
jgi:hypothetical protein